MKYSLPEWSLQTPGMGSMVLSKGYRFIRRRKLVASAVLTSYLDALREIFTRHQ
jgi:hypothetical protein